MMQRSVSIDLPTLSPGSYSVYISISGERHNLWLSTEKAVQVQCEARDENEKFAQVGQAYDLAHSKAASYLGQIKRARETAETKQASEARV